MQGRLQGRSESSRCDQPCPRLERHHGVENPTFADIKEYYDQNLHPDVVDLNDQEVYKNIFHEGKWVGIFQFAERGAQNFAKKATKYPKHCAWFVKNEEKKQVNTRSQKQSYKPIQARTEILMKSPIPFLTDQLNALYAHNP